MLRGVSLPHGRPTAVQTVTHVCAGVDGTCVDDPGPCEARGEDSPARNLRHGPSDEDGQRSMGNGDLLLNHTIWEPDWSCNCMGICVVMSWDRPEFCHESECPWNGRERQQALRQSTPLRSHPFCETCHIPHAGPLWRRDQAPLLPSTCSALWPCPNATRPCRRRPGSPAFDHKPHMDHTCKSPVIKMNSCGVRVGDGVCGAPLCSPCDRTTTSYLLCPPLLHDTQGPWVHHPQHPPERTDRGPR